MHNSNNKIVIKIKDLYVNDFILGCKVVLFWGLGEVDGLWPPPSNKIYLSIKYHTDRGSYQGNYYIPTNRSKDRIIKNFQFQ